jgi:photosystem II stability/assembly factor-like uncharacterized protein
MHWFNRFAVCFVVSVIAVSQVFMANAQWSQVNIGTIIELRAITFASQSVGYIVGDSGAVFKTTNSGMTWTRLTTTGVNVTLRALSFVNENVGVVVGDNATILRTTDGGTTWTRQTPAPLENMPFTGSLRGVSFINATTGWISGELVGLIQKTTDGGATWTTQAGQRSLTTRDITGIQFRNANLGYAIARGGFFYRTTNGSTTWQESRPYGSSGNPRTQNLFFTTDTTGFVVGSPQSAPSAFVARTTTGDTAASAWTVQMTPLARIGNDDPRLMSVHFADMNNGVICSRRGFLLRTTNAGTTWTQETNPAGTGDLNGVWVTPNGTAFAVGAGGVLLRRSSITGVRVAQPEEFAVRVSPNPVQSAFQLAYTLMAPESVRVELVNVFGQTVATADFGKQSAGAQSAQIHLDENLPRGVYFYRLMLGSTTVTGKIIRE